MMTDGRYYEIVEYLIATGEVIEGASDHTKVGLGDHDDRPLEEQFDEVERIAKVVDGQVDQAFRYLEEIYDSTDEITVREAIEQADAECWVYNEALRRAYTLVAVRDATRGSGGTGDAR